MLLLFLNCVIKFFTNSLIKSTNKLYLYLLSKVMEEFCFSYLEITAVGLISFIVGAILVGICKH